MSDAASEEYPRPLKDLPRRTEGGDSEDDEDMQDTATAVAKSAAHGAIGDHGDDGQGEGGANGEDEDEEDDEDEDEDEDDEDDEEDEDEEGRGGKAKRKRRRKRRNLYIDDAAVVDDEEDEEEEEGEEGFAGLDDDFIVRNEAPGARRQRPGLLNALGADDDEEEYGDQGHRGLDQSRRDEEDEQLSRIADKLKEKYGRGARAAREIGQHVPKNLLMPSVEDPSIWAVRCKPGRERDLVASIFRKSETLYNTTQALQIISAFCRDSLKGYVYIEARQESDVRHAIRGLVGVYANNDLLMVPLDQMPDLLKTKKRETQIVLGGWVRIKRGKYAGDLAQVNEIMENADEVGLRFVPRIDLNPKEEGMRVGPDGKKRKKGSAVLSGGIGFRPPQRFFNPEEVRKAYKSKEVTRTKGGFSFQGDFFRNGYIEKDIRITGLEVEDVNPTIDEVARFLGDDSEANQDVNLSQIAELTKRSGTVPLQPGDHVEIFEGDQKGIHGTVHSINNDVVVIDPSILLHPELKGSQTEIPTRSVRKSFKAGDHVKVMSGQNVDETGLVIRVRDDIVTFLSDLTLKEVQVFSRDLREAAEVGSSVNTYGQYELHDMVQLDPQTVGVIFKIDRDTFRVLDQNGVVRSVQPSQISEKKSSKFAIATDADGQEIAVNDSMKEKSIGGGPEGRKGRVLHMYRSIFVFLHSKDQNEHGGVFVTQARRLVSETPRGSTTKKTEVLDLSKMNPEMANRPPVGQLAAPAAGQRFRRDDDIGRHCHIIRGPNKGLQGIIKDINGPLARVELHTNNKIITIEKTKLGAKGPDGRVKPLAEVPNQRSGHRPGGNGSYMPSHGNPYSASTNAGQRTAYGDGGRTSYGNAPGGSRTSYGGAGGMTSYGGGRTSYGGGGSQTSYGGAGGQTSYGGAGGQTSYGGAGVQTSYGGAGGQTSYGVGGGQTSYGGFGGEGGRTSNPYSTNSAPGVWDLGTRSTPSTNYSNPYATGGQTPAYQSSRTPSTSQPEPSGYEGTSVPSLGRSTGPPQTGRDMHASTRDAAPTPYTAPTPYQRAAPTPVAAPTPAAAPTPGGAYSAATPWAAPTPFAAPTPGGAGLSAPTPGAGLGSSHTPYLATTPGAGLSTAPPPVPQPATLPEAWPLPGIEVVISRSKDLRSFNSARFDDEHAVVVGRGSQPNAWNVRLLDPKGPNIAIPPVPAEFLEAVRPGAPGDDVIVLVSPDRGKGATTVSRDGSDWMVEMKDSKEQKIYEAKFLAVLAS